MEYHTMGMKAKEIIDEVYSGPILGRGKILEDKLTENGYKWLGRQIDFRTNQDYIDCKSKGHHFSSQSHSIRGSDDSYRCDECKLFYKIDCSD